MNVCELSWRGWRPAVAAAAVALLLAGCFDRGERPAADAPGQPLAQCGAQAALVGVGHPSICLAYPASGAVSLPLGARPYLKFGRDIDPTTLTAATFTLSGPGGLVEGTVEYDPQRRDAFFVPANPLLGNATYVATLSADVQHSDGTGVAEYSWSFATGPATARYLYAANGDGTISVLAIDDVSGALRHHTYFVPEDVMYIERQTASADGRYVFAGGSILSEEASLWLVDTDAPGPGQRVTIAENYLVSAFVPVPGRTVGFVLTTPDYVTHVLSRFSFTGGTWSTGEIITLPDDGSGNPLFTPYDVVADPRGRYIALVGGEAEANPYVALYPLDEAGWPEGEPHVLSVTEAEPGDDYFYDLVAHPTGDYLYAIDPWNAGAIHTIQVASNGGLTWRGLVSTDDGLASFALHPSGEFAFVRRPLSTGGTAIDTYAVDPADGTLALTEHSIETEESWEMRSMAVDSSGRFLYASSDMDGWTERDLNEVAVFNIAPDGSLTPHSIMAGRRWPTDLALVHGAAPLTYTTENAYVLFGGPLGEGLLQDYGVDQADHDPLAPSPLPSGLQHSAVSPSHAVIDPLGRALFVGGATDQPMGAVAMFDIGAAGALSELLVEGSHLIEDEEIQSPFSPAAIEPSGRFLYAADNVTNDIHRYSVGEGGVLTYVDGVYDELPDITDLLVHPTGRFLYVFTVVGVFVYQIDSVNGVPSNVQFEPLFEARWALDPTGRFLWAAPEAGDVGALLLAPDTGLPTLLGPGVELPDLTAVDLAIHPTGRFIYVADNGIVPGGDGVIQVLELDPLVEVEGQSVPGELTELPDLLEAPSAGPLWSLHIDAAGQLLYVGTEGGGGVGEVLVYRIGEDGGLTYLDTLTQGARPQVVTRTRVE